jgi:hypothetical protein
MAISLMLLTDRLTFEKKSCGEVCNYLWRKKIVMLLDAEILIKQTKIYQEKIRILYNICHNFIISDKTCCYIAIYDFIAKINFISRAIIARIVKKDIYLLSTARYYQM